MTILRRTLKSITWQGLNVLAKFGFLLIGTAAIGIGALLGYLINSPESAELAVSIVVLLALLLIIMNNPLNGMLVWLFFTPFIGSWINIPLGAGIPDLELDRFAVAFLLILMLAKASIGQFRFSRIGLVEISIAAMTLGIALSAPLSRNPNDVLQSALSMYFIPLSLYFFAKNLVKNKDDLHKLLLVIAILGFVLASYVIYEQATGNILLLAKGREEKTDTYYTESLRMIRGILGRPGHFGRVLTTAIPIALYLFFESKTIARKSLLVGMLVTQASGMFLTYNRTSWYALLIGLSILPFFYPQFRKVYLIIVLLAAVALWATWDEVNDSAVVEERVNLRTDSYNGRTPRWEAGWAMWKVKPIRGWGFGRYEEESGRFRTDGVRWNFIAIENDYLHILVGSGLIGFLPYLLFLLTPLVQSLRLFIRARTRHWTGFIRPETLAIYWAVILPLVITSYTQIQTKPIVKMLPFAVAGAVVGSHERLLCSKTE